MWYVNTSHHALTVKELTDQLTLSPPSAPMRGVAICFITTIHNRSLQCVQFQRLWLLSRVICFFVESRMYVYAIKQQVRIEIT